MRDGEVLRGEYGGKESEVEYHEVYPGLITTQRGLLDLAANQEEMVSFAANVGAKQRILLVAHRSFRA